MALEIHNFSEIPDLKLKYIDPAKDILEVVEVFNYNMGQIYKWWKNNYVLSQNGNNQTDTVIVHGINVQGEQGIAGESGNSIHFVNYTIVSNDLVTDASHIEEDYIISGNNIFLVTLFGDILKYVLIGSLGGSNFILPVTGVSITSHSVIDWSILDNSATSILSPYINTADKIEYYRINVGDYKKSSSINASLVLTNILEKRNDGTNTLPTDAVDSTSKDFSQLIFQYRKGYNTDIIAQIVTHKFYESANNGFYYNITNGQNQINIMTNGNISRWMTSDISNDGLIEIRSLNIKLFASQSVMFYHDNLGENYYLAKTNYSNPLPWLNLGFRLQVSHIGSVNIYSNTYNVYDATVGDYIPNYALPYQIREIDPPNNAWITANFDATGLGTGLYKGWAVCNGNNGTKNRNGRVGVAWGTIYSTIGSLIGAKEHTLTMDQLPNLILTVRTTAGGTGGSDDKPARGTGGENENNYPITKNQTTHSQPHNNMQPSIISLFIMKLP